MNFTAELRAAAPPELADLTDMQWGFLHAIFEWRRSDLTLVECRARLLAYLDDPIDVASRPVVRGALLDLRARLLDVDLRDAIEALRPVYLQKRDEFRATQNARRAAIEEARR